MADTKPKRGLPTLQELHHDIDKAFANDKFNFLMNQPPHESWIKKHPIITGPDNKKWEYIPIDKIEFMVLRIFGEYKIEILREGALFNSVYSIVRLNVKHPISGEWTFHDGFGACPVQTDKGFSAADLSHIKSGAVQMAGPASVSYAIKDAAEHFGKLFGRDLNKKDTIAFSTTYWDKNEQSEEKVTPPPPPPGSQTANFEFEL